MQNWLSILQEFPVPEPAVTVSGGDVPPLEPLPRVILFDVYGTLVCPHLGDLADQAQKEGINDLRRSGLMKVKQGVTGLEEVNRVTT